MIKDKVNLFVGSFLSTYNSKNQKIKYVHDPLWGTVELYAHEIEILDTPLLQRLRSIHQTGFVYETYPSAQHTRFEHTIGVVHLAGKIVSSLRKKYGVEISEDTEYIVRLAALMHDTGHSAFSHTTEELYQDCDDMLGLIGKSCEFEGKGAGEVLSHLITTSENFNVFFNKLKERHTLIKNISPKDFAGLILGWPRSADLQYEADIISGAFDADKLDYFPRDGRAVGIDLSIDIERLLRCIEIQQSEDKKKTLVVNRGGYNALQQLLFARATLFASVYHHHKVRACDSMVKSCFNYYIENNLSFKKTKVFPEGFKLLSAIDYLYITDFDFFSEADKYSQDEFNHEIIHNLLYRRLIKRVLTISTSTIKDYYTNEIAKAGYSEFYNERSNQKVLKELALEIYKRADISSSKWFITIDIPRKVSFDKAGKSLINKGSKESPDIENLSSVIPVKEWVLTYDQYFVQSYIFGPEDMEDRKKISLAAIQLFKEKYEFELNQYSLPEELRDS